MRTLVCSLVFVSGIMLIAGAVLLVVLAGDDNGQDHLPIVVGLLIAGGIAETSVMLFFFSTSKKKPPAASATDGDILYADNLVTLCERRIYFHHYYLSGSSKSVELSELERIDIKKPTLGNGKWRLWGTGNFRTWFPCDWDRPSRDTIFVASLRGVWTRIGFTVEDSKRFKEQLQDKQILQGQATI